MKGISAVIDCDGSRPLTSHCFHWTHDGELCCDCGLLDPDGSLWAIRDCPGPKETA